jgi:hypothetical protein
MNLSSLGSFSSLATNALDTARSTFKGLADAATDASASPSEKAAEHKAAQNKAARTKRVEAKAAEVKFASKTEGPADTAETKVKGRFGTVLDAYA